MDFKEYLEENRFLSKKVSITKTDNKTNLKKGKVDHNFIDSMDLSKSIIDEIVKEVEKDGFKISDKKKKSILSKLKKTPIFSKIKKIFENEYLEEAYKPRKARKSKKVTKVMWNKMTDDQKENALGSVFKDPDDALKYIEHKWEELPSVATSNMLLWESESLSGEELTEQDGKSIKVGSNITWKNDDGDTLVGTIIKAQKDLSGVKVFKIKTKIQGLTKASTGKEMLTTWPVAEILRNAKIVTSLPTYKRRYNK